MTEREIRLDIVDQGAALAIRARSGQCDGEATVTVPRGHLEELFREDFSERERLFYQLSETELVSKGRELFNAIFRGDLLSLFDAAEPSSEEGVLRLCIDLDPEQAGVQSLEVVPWELLYWERGNSFLGLNRSFSIVRSHRVPMAARKVKPASEVKCLAVCSAPTDMENLSSWLEMDTMRRTAGPHLAIEESPSAQPQRVREALLESKATILHFAGHGYRDRAGDGFEFGLCFEGPQGRQMRKTARQCADLVRGTDVAVAVLNACGSGAESLRANSESFHGVAQRLIRAGLPAVVAMRYPIPDSSATAFAACLYRRLLQKDPLELAVTEARNELAQRSGDPAWVIPALFLRAPGTQLFEKEMPESDGVEGHPNERSDDSALSIEAIETERFGFVGEDFEPGSFSDLRDLPKPGHAKTSIRDVKSGTFKVVGRRYQGNKKDV